MLLRHFLDYLEVVPVSPEYAGFTVILTFHVRCSSVVRTLYFKIFSASFFLSNFCFLKLQRVLTDVLRFHYHGLCVLFIVRTASVDLYLIS